MLEKNKKTKKSKKVYPVRLFGYITLDMKVRLFRVSKKTGRSVSDLLREGVTYILNKYEG